MYLGVLARNDPHARVSTCSASTSTPTTPLHVPPNCQTRVRSSRYARGFATCEFLRRARWCFGSCEASCNFVQPELAVTTRNDNFTPSAYKTHCRSARSRAVHQFRRRRTENSQYPVYMGVSRPYPRCRKPSICSTDPYFRAREQQIVSSPSLRWRAPTDPLTTQTPVNSLYTNLGCFTVISF